MTDVRVNLLPGEVHERNLQRRNMLLVAAGVLVLLLVLVAGFFYQVSRVNDAEDRLAREEEELAALEDELAELEEYRELAQRAQASAEAVAVAMGGEVSVAGLMQDVAAVMPAESQLDTLDLTITPEAEPELGDRPLVLGQLSLTGRTLEGHAPGVERLLLEFGKIASFSDLFVSSSSLEQQDQAAAEQDAEGVVAFTVEADLGPEAQTRRYVTGLPEGLR